MFWGIEELFLSSLAIHLRTWCCLPSFWRGGGGTVLVFLPTFKPSFPFQCVHWGRQQSGCWRDWSFHTNLTADFSWELEQLPPRFSSKKPHVFILLRRGGFFSPWEDDVQNNRYPVRSVPFGSWLSRQIFLSLFQPQVSFTGSFAPASLHKSPWPPPSGDVSR